VRIYAVICIFPYLQLLSKLFSMLLVYFQACKIALILVLGPGLLKQFVLCYVIYCSHLPQQKYTKRSSSAPLPSQLPASWIRAIRRAGQKHRKV